MRKITVALAGNPNAGKSTIFNCLTGHRQHVGNWPGVTVEKLVGDFVFENYEIVVTDLPGIYSLTAYTVDERIARGFILNEKPDVVVCVVDASNLERNLYLVSQILELEAEVVLNLNMMDIAENRGIEINQKKLAGILDVLVCPTVANRAEGIDQLKEAIILSKDRTRRGKFRIYYGDDIESIIDKIQKRLVRENKAGGFPPRWVAIKLLEGDIDVLATVGDDEGDKEIIEEVSKDVDRLEAHFGCDIETALVERRYGYLEGLVRECMERKIPLEKRHEISDSIDKIVTNKYLGIPIFLLLMYLSFQVIFKLAGPVTSLLDIFFTWLASASKGLLAGAGFPGFLVSLVSEGVIPGVGSVLVFFPNIFILYVVIAVLEDSGYMARAAYIMDRFMHFLGLHGKSFIPMVLGFGCNIPAVLATRTLESRKDRLITILIIPLMSCSARMPIYILFASAFFPEHKGLVVFSIYVIGIAVAIVMAKVFRGAFFKLEDIPLIMEMPPYRMIMLKAVMLHSWERSKVFLKKAGTIILAGSCLIWLLATLPVGVEYASRESFLGKIGSLLDSVFSPAGFGNWQSTVALLSGIVAKEIVVGTLGTIFGASGQSLQSVLHDYFTPLSAFSFMVTSLIYIPCVAAMAVIKMEAGWRWMLFAVFYTLSLGWIVAVGIFQVGSIFI